MTAPTVPTDDDPYLAIVFRAVEEDGSNQAERMEDANNVAGALRGLSTQPSAEVINAALTAIVPETSDDLIGSEAVVIRDALPLLAAEQTVPDIDMTGPAHYEFVKILLSCKDGDRGSQLSRLVLETIDPHIVDPDSSLDRDDDAAAEFIQQASTADLALLDRFAANRLLLALFAGHTSGRDEEMIIRLVGSLPSTTVLSLATQHGKTQSAYSAEVDGDNWDDLKEILRRSIPISD